MPMSLLRLPKSEVMALAFVSPPADMSFSIDSIWLELMSTPKNSPWGFAAASVVRDRPSPHPSSRYQKPSAVFGGLTRFSDAAYRIAVGDMCG